MDRARFFLIRRNHENEKKEREERRGADGTEVLRALWKLVAAREWSGKCVLRKLPAESGAASASQEVSGKLSLPVATRAVIDEFEIESEELLDMDLEELDFEAAGGVA